MCEGMCVGLCVGYAYVWPAATQLPGHAKPIQMHMPLFQQILYINIFFIKKINIYN